MTLDEFRLEMAAHRRSADDVAAALKDSQVAIEILSRQYKKFNDAERRMADQVLTEWVLSEDENLRFDALSLISEFKINTSIPDLRKLSKRLILSTAISAPYELKTVEKIISKLENIEL